MTAPALAHRPALTPGEFTLFSRDAFGEIAETRGDAAEIRAERESLQIDGRTMAPEWRPAPGAAGATIAHKAPRAPREIPESLKASRELQATLRYLRQQGGIWAEIAENAVQCMSGAEQLTLAEVAETPAEETPAAAEILAETAAVIDAAAEEITAETAAEILADTPAEEIPARITARAPRATDEQRAAAAELVGAHRAARGYAPRAVSMSRIIGRGGIRTRFPRAAR